MEKLVRDRIPEIIRKKGQNCSVRIADDSEYLEFLKKKLDEETSEFKEAANAEELADILEVVYALADKLDIGKDQLEELRKKKADERGSFKEKLILREE